MIDLSKMALNKQGTINMAVEIAEELANLKEWDPIERYAALRVLQTAAKLAEDLEIESKAISYAHEQHPKEVMDRRQFEHKGCKFQVQQKENRDFSINPEWQALYECRELMRKDVSLMTKKMSVLQDELILRNKVSVKSITENMVFKADE